MRRIICFVTRIAMRGRITNRTTFLFQYVAQTQMLGSYCTVSNEPPVPCCMSGCANCVWIQHAENLIKTQRDGEKTVRQSIDNIQDENLKAFVKLELKLKRLL
ncbi:oxidoreductase-like domain-containing protein 1 isoform X2 [Corticium candelabrum]|uniref:oxidoreductase-like domain-containing protein 1 isoform X2 n=1 Tax=Corticium candelabrum TaxID=121492 RepID=UPI002E34D3C2|nr:oxidoreductase-like domain-containing protein 1 isoform X2 [Corticium candelabrum]